MKALRFAAIITVFTVATAGLSTGQEKAKAKGQLPQGWSKLGLSDDQKQAIYELQTKNKAKIDDLEKQIREAKDKLYKDELAVLTAAQKARLKEILVEKAGDAPKKGK